ncbi:DNA polymerase III subunit delta [Guyparkeria hydrothermalis]|uniref:DNA polymerase III subunit delta n=1 Tax=Guyparkeria hydrothermalis TaxID=923 RepID=UPI0020219046|nr:DNA polymerase III subunit delta [Guyparkeria hydrothermalis]
MVVKPPEFEQRLARGLEPLYVLGGDQPLLIQEARDAIVAKAREAGCDERLRFEVDGKFDWGTLESQGASLSLFSSQRIIDLRLPTGKPGRVGSKSLTALADRIKGGGESDVWIVSLPRLDNQLQKSAWFKALANAGVAVRFNDIPLAALPNWVAQRAGSQGVNLTRDAAELIAGRVEGNLLAAAQEIEKLALMDLEGPVDAARVAQGLANQSRVDTFALSDAILAADRERALYLLSRLRAEGTEPLLILWVIARDLRALVALAGNDQAGFKKTRIPAFLARRYQARARMLPASAWQRLLAGCAEVDRCIKGLGEGCNAADGGARVWALLDQVMLHASRPGR